MKIMLSLIIIAACYYSFSYGIYLWKIEKERLAGFGVLLLTFLGIVIPIAEIYIMV
ncbi:hypothetical protein [Clostridium sp. JS66]|uniref:hypothetical protein n=1 Tax=Clostridium sp. JS66 TaxID=3064705 RepID=UPI00298E0F11|nr:hypothetical protein [Clostridium sp. JS66]WPC44044.1 hypothetical protein Q6H37_11375 [Clostridium sp. JS66]